MTDAPPTLRSRSCSRTALAVCTVLAAAILWGTGLLGLRALAYAEALWGSWGIDGPVSLRGQSLPGAPLRGRNLRKTDFRGTNLRRADLSQTDMTKADLREADLRGANLTDANLRRADLTGAQLDGAVLTGAIYNRDTRWPSGFRPREHGAVLVE